MEQGTRHPVRRLMVSGAVVLTALALAGCTGPAPSGGGGTVTVTVGPPSAGPTRTPEPSSPGPAPSSTPSSPAPSGATGGTGGSGSTASRCTAGELTGSIGGGDAAAGSTTADLRLRNTGGRTCTLQGWPGVSFITSDGKQVGAAAILDRSSLHTTVTLRTGTTAHAAVKIADALNFPRAECGPVAVMRLRVYPPGSTESIVIATRSTTACSNSAPKLLTVQAFRPTT